MAPGQGVCDNCGAPVLRLFTTTSSLVELDPEPSDNGTRVIIDTGELIRVHTLTGTDLPHLDGHAHRIHQCPQPAEGDRCAAHNCSRPPGVPLLDAYHPDCHPEVTDQLLAEQRARARRQFRQGARRARRRMT